MLDKLCTCHSPVSFTALHLIFLYTVLNNPFRPNSFLLFQEAFPDYTSSTHSFLLLTIIISNKTVFICFYVVDVILPNLVEHSWKGRVHILILLFSKYIFKLCVQVLETELSDGK